MQEYVVIISSLTEKKIGNGVTSIKHISVEVWQRVVLSWIKHQQQWDLPAVYSLSASTETSQLVKIETWIAEVIQNSAIK